MILPLQRDRIPLPAAMGRLAAELRVLGQSLRAVEHAVEILFLHESPERNLAIENLQTIDTLGQTLASLADFAERLAQDIPAQVVVDIGQATGDIRLSALASRLRAENDAGKGVEPGSNSEIEYF